MSNLAEHRHPGGHKHGRKWSVIPWSKAGKSARLWHRGIDIEESQENTDAQIAEAQEDGP